MPLLARRWPVPALAGALVMLCAAPAAAATPAQELLDAGPGPIWSAAAVVARWAAYLAVLTAAGGAAFLAWAHRGGGPEAHAVTRAIGVAAGAGIAATVLRIPLQAVEIGGPGALTDLAAWEAVLASRFGLTALAVGAGLVLLLLALAQPGGPASRTLGVAGGAVAVAAFAFAGHSAVGEPRWLSITAMAVHNAAAAVWAGGLATLAVLLRRAGGGPTLVGTVERFSLAATASVLAVAIAGAAVAWVQVGAWSALLGTDYGRMLAAKGVLVAVVVAAGAYNRYRLVPALRRRPAAAWASLRRAVSVEVVGVVGIVAVTAVLAGLTPARVAAGIGEIFSDVAGLDEGTAVQLVIDPNRVGTNEAHLYLLDDAGRPVDVADAVRLSFVAPGEAERVEVTPARAGPGHFLHTGGEIDRPGQWRVEVVVSMAAGGEENATFHVVPGRGARTAASRAAASLDAP